MPVEDTNGQTEEPETHGEETNDLGVPELQHNESKQQDEVEGQPDLSGPKEPRGRPWINYRVEYRGRRTEELIYGYDAETHESDYHDENSDDKVPAFELVTTFKISDQEPKKTLNSGNSRPTANSPPSYHIKIYSLAIINALQAVVRYYPGQDLTGDSVCIKWPYPILVHHYDELSEFRDRCKVTVDEELCRREKDAYKHINLLLDFLDLHVMESVRAEQHRNKEDRNTFEWQWIDLKPGATILTDMATGEDMVAGVVQSVSGGTFDTPSSPWLVTIWNLVFDGDYLGRRRKQMTFEKFDGEQDHLDVYRLIDLESDTVESEVSKRIGYGKTYWNLIEKQCKHYQGHSRSFPYNKPDLMTSTDLRNWTSDCNCTVCRQKPKDKDSGVARLFEHYNFNTPKFPFNITDHHYFLCPVEIPAFVFRTRTWENLHLSQFSDPQFEESMIKNLVMDSDRLKTIKALAKGFARVDRHEEQMSSESWAADFVKGKGNGLIFLLHGRPGVGKTCTAECIAAFTKRPLMVLTCSDIGVEPKEVEKNLMKHFKTATSWGAVLLIDEADVFMERRTTADLNRNSLVAGFLRALEFYDGILFLTTNRVGSFDDAFISRIHIQLYYPDFTDEQRQQVWKTFIDKLAQERGESIRLNLDAKDYIQGKEMREIRWNGREIRNAFQTAVTLAEYDARRDAENKILVTDEHLKAVVKLSKDFKSYLFELHRGDEGKRAERGLDRLDSYDKR
ncbi:P-loop containing nucleoside triphosphate hydrolase protein [Tothia fuscella]|uniref:P-loop containing nucleoside triphosphate hydrolase protein n=1 Tax=Tothia fuscella TaxID=1048955 RepID=A0A9P4TZX8_9PEZI|nr:P-loop containing nucleoside triphosphate hydrolase protein [Tothia fuscella]